MFKEVLRPMFLLWAFCMLLTAATELGPQKWQESVITSTTKGAVSGTLILVYTSGMMFVLRHFAGPIAHKLSPTGMLIGSSILAGTGLYLLSYANSPATAFGYATIFGLGIAYFWPTMLGVSAERFPKGGALILALMGTVGNLSIAQVLPRMGQIADHYGVAYVEKNDPSLVDSLVKVTDTGKKLNEDEIKTLQTEDKSTGSKPAALAVAEAAQREGFSWAFRWVSLLPVLLVVLFGGIFLYDKARGGYKPEVLMSREEENELFAGGVQAEVH
jgi:hypothetical protein